MEQFVQSISQIFSMAEALRKDLIDGMRMLICVKFCLVRKALLMLIGNCINLCTEKTKLTSFMGFMG